MKRLWIELQRWTNGRVIRCRDCDRFDGMKRLRAPLAYAIAQDHRLNAGHRVKDSYFGPA